MQLETQVTNLTISQRLRELGVPQKSLYLWVSIDHYNGPDESPTYELKVVALRQAEYLDRDKIASAFTASELGEMLPVSVRNNALLACGKRLLGNKGLWYIEYMSEETGLEQLLHADTEADARGKMLIYLLENHLTTL